ncbi:MAG: pilus assembly protein [Rhodoferax sp.]|nr:pilus assembly protein [Rhodoferax sp.]
MKIPHRVSAAIKAGCSHLLCSLLVAALAGGLVFGLWYPFPYRELSGGRELFLLIVSVDVVCGPLLTLVLFNPAKPRAELWRDLGLVVMIQLGALGYGLWTVWQARPLFLVQEVDRFKVVAAPDLRGASTAGLPAVLQPGWFSGPVTVAIREPKDANEGQTVLFESLQGGRDYAERPEFYLPYEGTTALKALSRAKPLAVFLQKQPSQETAARTLAAQQGADMTQWLYLPVMARQDWVAVLDKQGQIQGFLQGDGF